MCSLATNYDFFLPIACIIALLPLRLLHGVTKVPRSYIPCMKPQKPLRKIWQVAVALEGGSTGELIMEACIDADNAAKLEVTMLGQPVVLSRSHES
ncbi:hypothetical protein BD311DRAFT_242104 [Dichomitus squalens]|uniref:Uncharacterized protein n=1 Tax=Dichomitus squalens TaxID=114155 RepID=A0A4V2K0U6_9APHY|nr:hypothetical protein BD311DRAFT_242104 [Dichomitus squalens]